MKKEKQTSAAQKTRPAGKKEAGAERTTPAKTGTAGKKETAKRTEAAGTLEKVPAPAQFEPRIIAFVCRWCSDAYETGGPGRKGSAAGRSAVRFVSLMCSGRVQPSLVLKSFELGADGVIICGCGPGKCHYYFGNERQAEMFEISKKLISLLGLEGERLRLEWIQGADGDRLGAVLDEFTEKVRHAGPSPLRK